ncbi:MAG: hypothetical protein H8E47_07045, partial [Anaerolineales bacterium]|nr:hypothetical protein [Anaerolineales bacterium]
EYRYTLPNGDYEVTLKFAEFEVDDATDRQMRITIEGMVVEDALSIYGEVGQDAALDRIYQVTVSDGELNVVFEKSGGEKHPVISAIAVVQVEEGGVTEPTPTPTDTPLPPTPTPTNTPLSPTATPTATATPLPPTSTPTPTNTPVPLTATPTATATPLSPTSTPTPVPPSPTPIPTDQSPSTGCIVEGGQFGVGNDRIEWALFNKGSNTVTIESISVSWPTALGNLKKAKLDGDTFFEEDRTPPSTTIDTFIGELQKRQINAGDDRKLKFEFREKAAIGESDYTITVNFEESCSVQSSVLVAGSVLLGDLNGDCEVNVIDTMLVASAWQSTDPTAIAQYDLDDDDDVDIVDVMLVVGQWGNSCTPTE